jgi:invasion protein IalB
VRGSLTIGGMLGADRVLYFAILLILGVAIPGAVRAQATSKVSVGAWDLRCETFQDLPKASCGLTQTVHSEEHPALNLAIVVVKPPWSRTAVMRVIAPPNVFLLNGVNMKIDQSDIGAVPFSRCSLEACFSDAPLDETLLEKMRTGKIATLVTFMDPGEGLRHHFLLEGFKEALEQLH